LLHGFEFGWRVALFEKHSHVCFPLLVHYRFLGSSQRLLARAEKEDFFCLSES
jgi:hypothetical protein